MDETLKSILVTWEQVGVNDDIVDLLSEVDRKNQAVERYRGDEMTQAQFAEIIRDIQFEFVYNSNAIEGNALSLRETRELLKVAVHLVKWLNRQRPLFAALRLSKPMAP